MSLDADGNKAADATYAEYKADANTHGKVQVVSTEAFNDAVQAENREHEMGLWESFKEHPMACFWAFVFCFTIVSTFCK